MKKNFCLFTLLVLSSFAFAKKTSTLLETLSLKEAENLALVESSEKKAADQNLLGAQSLGNSFQSLYLPKLSLDGHYGYVAEIPEIEVGPKKVSLGDHHNYSLGLVLSYSLFDGGRVRHSLHSARDFAEAKRHQLEDVKDQILLKLRLSYVKAQILKREYKLVLQTLELTNKQAEDVKSLFLAGAKSKLDFLSAKREVSSMKIKVEAVLGELKLVFKDLEALVSKKLDPFQTKLEALEKSKNLNLPSAPHSKENHPKLLYLTKLSDSRESAAKSEKSAFWPKLFVSLKTSLDYPNGPTLENIHQNTIAVGFKMPLLDWNRARHASAQKRAEASALRYTREEVSKTLTKEEEKARTLLLALEKEKKLAEEAVKESKELSHLVYEAYKGGRITLTEVQASNLKLLASEVEKARIEGQILIQSYKIQSFTHTEL